MNFDSGIVGVTVLLVVFFILFILFLFWMIHVFHELVAIESYSLSQKLLGEIQEVKYELVKLEQDLLWFKYGKSAFKIINLRRRVKYNRYNVS